MNTWQTQSAAGTNQKVYFIRGTMYAQKYWQHVIREGMLRMITSLQRPPGRRFIPNLRPT
jgi:hypothetical protein